MPRSKRVQLHEFWVTTHRRGRLLHQCYATSPDAAYRLVADRFLGDATEIEPINQEKEDASRNNKVVRE
jgi:hypothetical protein